MRIVSILLCLSVQVQAQIEHRDIIGNSGFLEFLPNNDLISYARVQNKVQSSDSGSYSDIVTVSSFANGGTILQVPIEGNNSPWIYLMAVSKAGLEFVVLQGQGVGTKRGPLASIAAYSLVRKCKIWESPWDPSDQPLAMEYSADDRQVICVSSEKILFLDSRNGRASRTSTKVANFLGKADQLARFDLSKSGKYFAYWRAEYLTFSRNDEAFLPTAIDFAWYGFQWLWHLGSIPHWLYVWNTESDTLQEKIRIPFEAIRGTPSFSDDEKKIVVGPFRGEYFVYLLDSVGTLLRSFTQDDSASSLTFYDERRLYGIALDCKTQSPDGKFISACYNKWDVLLLDQTDGHLLRRWKQGTILFPGSSYAMAFSSDGKYFAIIPRDQQVHLYETRSWNELWGHDSPSGMN